MSSRNNYIKSSKCFFRMIFFTFSNDVCVDVSKYGKNMTPSNVAWPHPALLLKWIFRQFPFWRNAKWCKIIHIKIMEKQISSFKWYEDLEENWQSCHLPKSSFPLNHICKKPLRYLHLVLAFNYFQTYRVNLKTFKC